MEKFRQYTDEKTGVNAFVPIWVNHRPSSAQKACKWTVGVVYFVCRSLIGAIAALVYFLTSSLESSLGPRNVLSVALNYLLGWLGLFTLGYGFVMTSAADYKRLMIKPLRNTGSTVCSLRRDQVIISNFTSVVEPLVLGAYLNPMFIFPHADGSLSVLSLPKAISFSLSFSSMSGSGKYSSLSAVTKAFPSVPLVFFPEGQKSNGSCVLRWTLPKDASTDSELISSAGLVMFAYKQDKSVLSSGPHTTGSAFDYFLRMTLTDSPFPFRTDLVNGVSFVGGKDVAAAISSGADAQEQGEKVRAILARGVARGGSGVLVNSSGADLESFAKKWAEVY